MLHSESFPIREDLSSKYVKELAGILPPRSQKLNYRVTFFYLFMLARKVNFETKVKEKESVKNTNFCSNVWEETVINSTGIVTPCCMDAALEYPFGNAFSEDFKAIWNNAKYIEFREKILQNINQIKICNEYCYKKDNRINFIE